MSLGLIFLDRLVELMDELEEPVSKPNRRKRKPRHAQMGTSGKGLFDADRIVRERAETIRRREERKEDYDV